MYKKKYLFLKKLNFLLRITLLAALICLLAYLAIPGEIISAAKTRQYSSVICDNSGYPLRVVALEDGLLREYCDVKQISWQTTQILMTSEDKRFNRHIGVDLLAVGRAAKDYVKSKKIVSGASTITMQAARLLKPHDGGLGGKVGEAFLAMKLEMHLSKDEIFSIWLSNLPFGQNVEGFKSAASRYLQADISALTVEEAALLVIIPRSPSYYSPKNNPAILRQRALELLERSSLSFSPQRLDTAIAAARQGMDDYRRDFSAPHFCNFVEKNISPELKFSGAKIITSLDTQMQQTMQELISHKVQSSAAYRISNGAGLAVETTTGRIRAYVGSADFYSEDTSGQNDGVTAQRQPGSTLKPFLYELALEKGFTPSEVLPDIPMAFGTREVYTPMNFTNRFSGPVRLRVALASSLNVPAVYTLQRLGVANFADRLISLGFDSLVEQKDNLGVGLALGNAEVSLYELAQGYTAFVNDGSYAKLRFLEKIEYPESEIFSKKSKKLSGYVADLTTPKLVSAMEKPQAQLIRDILSDRVHRVQGFGYANIFSSSFDAIYKTGTSNQFNNIWAMGASPQLTAGIWMGNFSGDTVIGQPGSSIPSNILRNFLKKHIEDGQFFPDLEGFTLVKTCTLSGKPASPHCPHTYMEKFVPGNIPGECDFHTASGICLPVEYSDWIASNNLAYSSTSGELPTIVEPIPQAVYYYSTGLSSTMQAVPLKITAGLSTTYEIYLNGTLHTTATGSQRISLSLRPAEYTVQVKAGDYTQSVNFSVR
ncbi:MAG: transglycosylase domain-containing protein [Spirochaetales bacterium]|nr:transglycosylase domain-containing protein [Spirochaetales bacterium]